MLFSPPPISKTDFPLPHWVMPFHFIASLPRPISSPYLHGCLAALPSSMIPLLLSPNYPLAPLKASSSATPALRRAIGYTSLIPAGILPPPMSPFMRRYLSSPPPLLRLRLSPPLHPVFHPFLWLRSPQSLLHLPSSLGLRLSSRTSPRYQIHRLQPHLRLTSDDLHLPIALRKGTRSCTQHPISLCVL